MFKEVEVYLANLRNEQRIALQKLRETIVEIVPDATETISTKVPAFCYKGKYLVSYSATNNHLALLVMQGKAVQHFKDDLAGFDTGKRIIRFSARKPIPKELVEKIVHFRMSEIDAKNKKNKNGVKS